MNTLVALCMIGMLWAGGQLSLYTNSQVLLNDNDGSLRPGVYWTLSSSWRWNATGTGDHTGWRVEREDWNDTLTVQEVSGGELLLRLKRVGRGSLEASGSYIIAGRAIDSWKIERQYSFKINATTFRDNDGNPARWITNVKGLGLSGFVPQMWTDKDYSYVEAQFQVTGSEQISFRGLALDSWVVSYGNLTTGYWSSAGKHSIGFKEETLNYDKRFGLLLRASYRGSYGLRTDEGAWNETETFDADLVDSNADFSAGAPSIDRMALIVFGLGLVATGAVFLALIVRSRRRSRSA